MLIFLAHQQLKLSSQTCLWVNGVCKCCKAILCFPLKSLILHFMSTSLFRPQLSLDEHLYVCSEVRILPLQATFFYAWVKAVCVFLMYVHIFDRSGPKCSPCQFPGKALSGHATHILHGFNSMRQLRDELERTENNTRRVKEYIRLSSYCIWIFSFVLVCVKAVTCSKCPCMHFVSSTPSAEYVTRSRPCAFMWRVVLVQ